VCDDSYAGALQAFTARLDDLRTPPCLPSNIRNTTDAQGNSYPDCVVTEYLTTADGVQQRFNLPPCATVPAGLACWSIGGAAGPGCPAGNPLFTVSNEPIGPDSANFGSSQEISCQLTLPADAGSCPN